MARGVAHAMFATGNSQLAFVDALVTDIPDVPWGDVVVFHMDEYVGIGDDHPASFPRWIRRRIERARRSAGGPLPRRLGRRDRMRPVRGVARRAPARPLLPRHRRERPPRLQRPRLADFDDPLDVKEVELDDGCRRQQGDEGHFATVADVPKIAVTVTVPALLRADAGAGGRPGSAEGRAPGASRLTARSTTSCPASILQRSPNATVFLDPDSSSLLGRR